MTLQILGSPGRLPPQCRRQRAAWPAAAVQSTHRVSQALNIPTTQKHAAKEPMAAQRGSVRKAWYHCIHSIVSSLACMGNACSHMVL